MRIIAQIGIVLLVCLLGEAIAAVLPFPFPASVIGMVLLFLLLACGWLKPHTGKVQLLIVEHGLLFYSRRCGAFEIPGCFSGKSDPPVGHLLGYNPLGLLCDRLDRTSGYEMDRIQGGQARCLKL